MNRRLRDVKCPTIGTVIILSPGGLNHGGGIGRQMGYFLSAHLPDRRELDYRVIDSRGPWFLGNSPFHIGLAGCYLLGSLIKLVLARFGTSSFLVHVNITGRGSTVRKALLLTVARAFGIRYLLHVHDYNYAADYSRRGTLMRSAVASVFRHATKVLTLGARDRDVLAELFELPDDRIVVLHNAVPDPLPHPTEMRYSQGPIHILFLGHLSARKGVPELLHALASPALRARQWRATLAGGDPGSEFRRSASKLGILERVDFPGWLDTTSVSALCADADVLVLPSHAEGLAMAVLEGLAHGLAVVTTPVGAHPEVIEPGVSGILVPPGNVAELTDALIRLIEDLDLRRRLGAGARDRFLKKFDVRGYAERLSELHTNLLLEGRPETLPIL
jgi:glycosyltransferase involved in cell wall biosynthesis